MGGRDNSDAAKYLANLFLASTPPEEIVRPMVEAEGKSRVSAFRLLGASLDRIVQK